MYLIKFLDISDHFKTVLFMYISPSNIYNKKIIWLYDYELISIPVVGWVHSAGHSDWTFEWTLRELIVQIASNYSTFNTILRRSQVRIQYRDRG